MARRQRRSGGLWFSLLFAAAIVAFAFGIRAISTAQDTAPHAAVAGQALQPEDLPAYNGSPYVILNDNQPAFAPELPASDGAFEQYSDLDALGRCGPAFANLGRELMPTEAREDIRDVFPSGWKNQKYEGIDQDFLYNRCHLIGFQLTGENANERNLITGTRSFNVDGMLPFENQVREYICRTGNHVLYRVTPLFHGQDLVARGVVLEARSVEDDGRGISLYVYIYNVQPGIVIDYATGASRRE